MRQAPPPPPQDMPAPSKRVVRQAPPPPEGALAPPSKRVAREAVAGEVETPAHIRQEAFYTSVTSVSREKRETSRG